MSVLKRLRGANVYQVDPIVAVLITLQILVNMWLAVKYSSTDVFVTIVNITFISLTVSGLVLHQAFCGGIKVDKRLVPTEHQAILLSAGLGLMLVAMLQTVVFRAQSAIALATVWESQLFYLTAGVAEETFFRYYLQTKMHQSLAVMAVLSAFLSVVMTSVLFTTYHFTVYSTQLYALIAVFASSLVLSGFYYWTKRLSVAQLIHGLANLMASGIIPR